MFSTSVLLVNVTCFFFIFVSYVYIGYKTMKSARNVGRASNQSRSDKALQAKIFAIILTDFFCWIPLSIVSFLHLSEVINAASWYPFFSVLILPINSVINPLLYDSPFYSKVLLAPGRLLVEAGRSIIGRLFQWRAVPQEDAADDSTPSVQDTAL